MIKRVPDVKWFKDNGSFSEEGEHGMIHFKDGLQSTMFQNDLKEMTISQLETLKCNMLKMVSESLFRELSERKAQAVRFASMTDEEFYRYLDQKYGADFWGVTNSGLEREEEDRLPPAKIRELLEKGAARVKEQKYYTLPEDKSRPRVKKRRCSKGWK